MAGARAMVLMVLVPSPFALTVDGQATSPALLSLVALTLLVLHSMSPLLLPVVALLPTTLADLMVALVPTHPASLPRTPILGLTALSIAPEPSPSASRPTGIASAPISNGSTITSNASSSTAITATSTRRSSKSWSAAATRLPRLFLGNRFAFELCFT
ncbi:hypothetical protein CPB84DRAFT_1794547 [Gymnopilus junonius]|uniref:Secreted protein n=1 Tax=Gymnopilus junonius TaxID=109634 RepID=A0A9P5TGG6_GYMJU|nr:hypothetical protein CPB84DRAFT_1794547 [Gymnopilus junonius]